MDKKIIVVAGVIIVAGGFVAHSMAGKSVEKQIQQRFAALEANEDIAVSNLQTQQGWGKTSVTAHLEAVEAPGLGGELAMDVGYVSREADGSMTFNGDMLNGVVDFTTELGSGKRNYTFNADELTAVESGVMIEQTEGSGYVDAEREHFALNVHTPRLRFADADGKVAINGLNVELEHNIAPQEGNGRSHARFSIEDANVTVSQNGRPLEAASLGATEIRNTAILDGDTLTSQLYFAAGDAVFMDSEPGRVELDITAEGLDYAAFEALSEALERNLDDLDAEETPVAEQQQALARDLQATLVEQAHTLLAHSPSLHLNTLTVDATLPMLGRATTDLSGSLMFDGDDLSQDATNALLADISADMRRTVVATQGRPAMNAREAQAEFAPRVSAELKVTKLPKTIVAELPPGLQTLLVNGETPHTFAWENSRPLYNGEPLQQVLER